MASQPATRPPSTLPLKEVSHPPAPIGLALIAEGLVRGPSICVVVLDHRVGQHRAQRGKPIVRGDQQRPGHSLAAILGIDCEPVNVTAPPVPAGHHRAHHTTVMIGGEHAS